jgi:hypothetical protein
MSQLITAKEVLKRSDTEQNLNASKILDLHIRAAIDGHLRPTLTDALVDKLIADEGTLLGDYKILMDDYLMDALACFVMYEAQADLAVKWTNSGINAPDPRYAQQADLQLREFARNQKLRIGETILARAVKFIEASEEIEEYESTDSTRSRAYFSGNMVIRRTK